MAKGGTGSTQMNKPNADPENQMARAVGLITFQFVPWIVQAHCCDIVSHLVMVLTHMEQYCHATVPYKARNRCVARATSRARHDQHDWALNCPMLSFHCTPFLAGTGKGHAVAATKDALTVPQVHVCSFKASLVKMKLPIQ